MVNKYTYVHTVTNKAVVSGRKVSSIASHIHSHNITQTKPQKKNEEGRRERGLEGREKERDGSTYFRILLKRENIYYDNPRGETSKH